MLSDLTTLSWILWFQRSSWRPAFWRLQISKLPFNSLFHYGHIRGKKDKTSGKQSYFAVSLYEIQILSCFHAEASYCQCISREALQTVRDFRGGEGCSTSSDRKRWSIFKDLCMLREVKWDLQLWEIKVWWLPGFWACVEGLSLSHSFFLTFPRSCLQCWTSVPYSATVWLKHVADLAYSVKINAT